MTMLKARSPACQQMFFGPYTPSELDVLSVLKINPTATILNLNCDHKGLTS